MVNLAVAYAGPDVALATLAAKLRRVYGNPARTYEFVTGYDRTGITSHNADSNGRAHAMDIFVGPGNLSEAQGIDLAERLRLEGKRGSIPGHPDRLAYIIHRGRIAGDHTGWEWAAYTGKDWHGDHIHVSSVFDYYWGDPVPGNPADYNSNADWSLWEAEFLSGTIEPIQEDDMPITDADAEKIAAAVVSFQVPRTGGGTNTLGWSLGAESERSEGIIARTAEAAARAVLTTLIPRGGPSVGGETTLAAMVAYSDQSRVDIINQQPAVSVPGLDQATVNAAISAGVQAALKDTTATITLGGPQ